jgi:hypothetical protein
MTSVPHRYGQTSSGKSYTMGTTGIEVDYTSGSNAEQNAADRIGMIPRAMSEIFSRAEAKKRESGAGATWECRLSFLELYNEVSRTKQLAHVEPKLNTIYGSNRNSLTSYLMYHKLNLPLSSSRKTKAGFYGQD